MGLILSAIIYFLRLVEFLIFVDAIMSWFVRPGGNEISRMIRTVTDPIITPCQRLQYRIIPNSPVDFSPIIAIMLIEFVKNAIIMIF